MTIDVVVYLSSLQKIAGRKKDVLEAFGEGCRRSGARVMFQTKTELIPAKLAVILGWPSPLQHTPNIRLRSAVVKDQKGTIGMSWPLMVVLLNFTTLTENI